MKQVSGKNAVELIVLAAMLLGFGGVHQALAGWIAPLHVEGENTGGVYQYEVVIGVTDTAEQVPAPPAPPPGYTVKMDLYDIGANEFLGRDIRTEGEESYMWLLNIDPNGDTLFPPRTATITWDPTVMGDGHFVLRSGSDGEGPLVIPDMKKATTRNPPFFL